MHFSAAAVLAFTGAALAQTAGFDAITKPTKGDSLSAGSTNEITWDYNSVYPGNVTLSLLGGASPSTLQSVGIIASHVDSSIGSWTWDIDNTLGSLATYGIQITMDSDPSVFQYSFPFSISAASSPSELSASGFSTFAASSVLPLTTTSLMSVVQSQSLMSAALPSSFTSVVVSSSVPKNQSTTWGGAETTETSVVTPATSPATVSKTSSPSVVPSSGAVPLGAGSMAPMALLGGLAMAALAL